MAVFRLKSTFISLRLEFSRSLYLIKKKKDPNNTKQKYIHRALQMFFTHFSAKKKKKRETEAQRGRRLCLSPIYWWDSLLTTMKYRLNP